MISLNSIVDVGIVDDIVGEIVTCGRVFTRVRALAVRKQRPSTGSVKDHLGSIGVVEASRMEVVLDGISPPRFGGGLWVFSSHGEWVKVIDFSYRNVGAIEQYTFCMVAILNFKMGATKIYLYLINPYFTSPTQL